MRHSTLIRTGIASLLLCLLTACATSDRTAIKRLDTDVDANFAELKTYRWDFAALGKIQPEGGHIPEFDRVLCEHVDKHMAERGYRRVDQGDADFVLDYRVVITQQEGSEATGGTMENEQRANEYGLRWTFDRDESPTFQGLQAPKDQTFVYRNGTLHLAAFDPQGRVIWHSSATRLLNGRGNEAERRAALRIAVNKLMDRFPGNK